MYSNDKNWYFNIWFDAIKEKSVKYNPYNIEFISASSNDKSHFDKYLVNGIKSCFNQNDGATTWINSTHFFMLYTWYV